MRFNQIHLTRFGCFTDHVIDFGEVPESGDFHIIYGPNEAGKSTLRDACLDFLYGISSRSKYNFLHDYSVMEVGARISEAKNSYEMRRLKGRKDTLISVGNSHLSETTLKAILGGISREEYEHMYSLNDSSLEAGGESILSSEGDLGALLFGAMSGLSDISLALAAAKEQTEKFFKTSARAFHLNDLKNDLKQIDEEIRNHDVEAGTYKRLKTDITQAEQQWRAKKADRDEKRSESRQLQELIEAHPIWKEYISIQDKLKPFHNAPNVPDGWSDEVNELIQNDTKARSKAESESKAVERAQTDFDTVVCDEVGLSIAEQVKRLQKDDLEARYKTSKDIESRNTERQRLQDSIENKLGSLEQSVDIDPRTLILPVARVGEIKSLMAEVTTIESDLKSATREWENAKSETEEAKRVFETHKAPDEQPVMIQSALKLTKEAPKPSEDAIKKARAERDTCIAALFPWQGDATELSTLVFPSEELIQRRELQDDKLSEESQELAKEDSQLRDNLAEHISIINTLVKEAKVISDKAASDSRQRRDAAWELHRDSLNETPLPTIESLQESADNFADALAVDDQLINKQFTQSTEIARLRQAQTERATVQAKLDRLAEKQISHDGQRKSYMNELEELFIKLNLPTDFKLRELKVWLERYKQALKAEEHLKAEETDLKAQKEKYKTVRNTLEDALHSYGLAVKGVDWSQLLQLGEETIESWTQTQQQKTALKESLSKAEKAETKRKRELESAQAEKAKWSDAWSSCLSETWLGEYAPVAIKEILNTLDILMVELKEADQLDDRIAAMNNDRERYCIEVQSLAQQANERFDELDPLSTADRLRKRVSEAEEAYKAKQKATKTLKDAKERLAIETLAGQQIAVRFDELRETIPARNLEELRSKMDKGLERDRLHKRSSELENDLIRRLNQNSIEASLSILNDRVGTPESLDKGKTLFEAFERDLADIDQQVSELYASWQSLERQLMTIGSDSAVAELVEQRHALLLEIEFEAHNFMRLSTGIMLANEALRTYRETHRSTMMEAASDAFSCITRGAFKGLSTAPQDDRELLFGVRADGSTILAPQMSRGTRYQLYLALRIAGHAELSRNGETLPFFADDILEPFDDDRSSETFTLLHEMAKHGQVVYLTHHQHLCDLAKKITDRKVKIHELPDRAISSQ